MLIVIAILLGFILWAVIDKTSAVAALGCVLVLALVLVVAGIGAALGAWLFSAIHQEMWVGAVLGAVGALGLLFEIGKRANGYYG